MGVGTRIGVAGSIPDIVIAGSGSVAVVGAMVDSEVEGHCAVAANCIGGGKC